MPRPLPASSNEGNTSVMSATSTDTYATWQLR
jgi:hypothetical protein